MNISLQQVVPTPLADKLSLRQSDVWNSNLVFAKGERIKIKAPSGTGKTTLVHILYKLRHDYRGELRYDQTVLTAITPSELSRYRQQYVSVIFQDMRLFANLTARENIELKRILYPPIYDATMIDSMAERLGITHILAQTVGTCSYGEQQRIAIIRSLMQPFEWLLMDEPFSHLDEANTLKAAALIDDECKKRAAGFILTDLDDDSHFAYTRMLNL